MVRPIKSFGENILWNLEGFLVRLEKYLKDRHLIRNNSNNIQKDVIGELPDNNETDIRNASHVIPCYNYLEEMGASLSSRFEWSQGATETSGLLLTTAQNQALLYEIISFINQLATKNSVEIKAEFKRGIQWTTELNLSIFANSELFIVQQSAKYV